MGKRPRIKNEIIGEPAPIDLFAFTSNMSSENARMVFTNVENVEFDIWFDKHYYIREQHGDNDGKRDGIDREIVQHLIIRATKHLLFYSLKVRAFSFVNFEIAVRNPRITVTLNIEKELKLNVVAQCHYLSLSRYEITIITAIRKNDFHFNDGEYQIEINKDGTSTLYKSERGIKKMIEEYLF